MLHAAFLESFMNPPFGINVAELLIHQKSRFVRVCQGILMFIILQSNFADRQAI